MASGFHRPGVHGQGFRQYPSKRSCLRKNLEEDRAAALQGFRTSLAHKRHPRRQPEGAPQWAVDVAVTGRLPGESLSPDQAGVQACGVKAHLGVWERGDRGSHETQLDPVKKCKGAAGPTAGPDCALSCPAGLTPPTLHPGGITRFCKSCTSVWRMNGHEALPRGDLMSQSYGPAMDCRPDMLSKLILH